MSDSRSGSIQNCTPAAGVPGLSDAERELLRDSIRDFLGSRWPVQQAVERSKDAQAIAALWREMSAQGWTALGADPAEGGMREIALAFEELGRASCPAPLLGAVAANLALTSQRASSGVASSLLDDLRRGKAWVAVAHGAFDGDPAAGRVELDNDARGVKAHDCTLNGRVAFVEGAAGATHFLVFSDAPAGAAIVTAGAQGLSIDETPGLAVPALCELSFLRTPAAFLAMSSEAIEDIAFVGRLACAARAVGAAQRAFELAVEHAKIRRQFGQYIGQFQAVQHKLADCLMGLDGARLTLAQAAAARDTGDSNWRAFGSAALAFAGPSIREVSIQTHRALGAIGYAEEHEAPRHFRRVHADLARFGGAPRARAELADFVLGDEAKAAAPGEAGVSPVSAFRQEVRAWLAKHWTQERRLAHDRRPFDKHGWDPEFSRVMGRDGWIGVGWPREFGGQGRSPSEQIAFIEEMARVDAPHLAHNIGETIVARALFLYGTPEQKAEYLPAILRGERSFSLGYSEPEAGSDLAALRSRAVREGDDWIVNGQKIWSTSADKAEYIWLAVRTDPEAKKHAGISVFMVDLRTPGIGIRPGFALYGKTFSTVFFDNVRVPSHAMVGGVNSGWKVITDALAAERIMMGASRKALIERAFDHMIAYIKTATVGGKVLKDDPVVRDRVGSLAAEIEVARQLLMRNAVILEQGRVPIYEAALSKVFSSELQERLGQAAIDILGTGATLSREADSAPVGELEQVLRHSLMGIISGGTNEIQRTLIAQRGLGLPR
ncbi:MAG: acyl-CoA dehydrogenase [Betaproteobacteria bacterium]|nr:acyl-CoA dehydrogenase [Betaproteobacteria bacterium]